MGKILFINASVFLGDGSFTTSIGFDNETGKILYTGNSPHKNNYDTITDLKGKLVIPAFTDAHVHLCKGSQVNSELNLRNAKNYNDVKTSIKSYISSASGSKKDWITGGYFAESNFESPFKITKELLDELIPDKPVILSRFDIHSGIANSKALEISGLLNEHKRFTESEVIQNASGELTGEVKERALYYIIDKISVKSLKEKASDLRKLIDEMHSKGITSIGDITLPEDLDVYEECLKQEELGLNINCILPFEEFINIDKYKKRFKEFSEIRFGCFKAFYDGSLSSKTAYYFDYYIGSDSCGIKTEFVNSGKFNELAHKIDKAGYQIAVHAIGDKAVSDLLDLNEKLNEINGKRDRRFRIEHAQHIHPKDIQRFIDLNVIASVQPSHLFSDASTSNELLKYPEREHSYKKIIEAGGKVILGTDYPIVDYSPFETIFFAVTRIAKGFEKGFFEENKFTIEDSIKCYTSENSFATFQESEKGTLKEGMTADLVVLNKNIFEVQPNEIKYLKPVLTIKDGRIIYSDEASAISKE